MRRIFGHFETQRGKARECLSICFPALLAVILLSGCSPFLQHVSGRENAEKFREAEAAFEQGKYIEARAAYRALAEDRRADPRTAELSQFRAAYILVYYKNPDRDYSSAACEFEEFSVRYPSGALADEARSWLDLLTSFEQSRTGELLKEVDLLTRRIEDVTKELQETKADGEAVTKERDLLLIDKNNLAKKVDELLNDKDSLLKEKTALLKERDRLGKEKTGLEKKVDILSRDKEDLALAKEKLEKSLRDLTMVDVKMEKKRKKVK